jgi:phosphatidylcholine synthase
MNWKKAAAFGVHFYTCLGVVLACLAALALTEDNVRAFLIYLWLAVFVDATDGTIARYFDVKGVFPQFNGERLDDIIDYITYAFLPALGLIEFAVLPGSLAFIAFIPLMASAYGFCQEMSKTEESFVGFPSFWNIVFLYLYILPLSAFWVVAIILVFSVLVFVPVHYIYPSKTRRMRQITVLLSMVYAALVGVVCVFPHAPWAEEVVLVSLLYPAYYFLLSVVHHFSKHRARARAS